MKGVLWGVETRKFPLAPMGVYKYIYINVKYGLAKQKYYSEHGRQTVQNNARCHLIKSRPHLMFISHMFLLQFYHMLRRSK